MKKVVILVLAVVYITLTSGVAVNVHYCMGKMAGVTYGVERAHECEKCGMQARKGCCETEHKLVKADDDHTASQAFSAKVPVFAAIITEFSAYIAPALKAREHIIPRYHAPPGIQSTDLCVLNSVFRV